jgi:phage baseplate assembly protein W
MSSISVKLPLRQSSIDGYVMNKSIISVIKQNLKMLVLTIPGERVMEPNYGVGLKRYLFENFSSTTASRINNNIREQVRIYMPAVKIAKITVDTSAQDANTLAVVIKYSVAGITTNDLLEITI